MALRDLTRSAAGGALSTGMARLNARHPWSHNDHFQRWILGNLPTQRRAAVDVGCGQGGLVATLAPRFDHVVGNDADAGMREAAARRCAGFTNVTIDGGDWTALDGPFDLVTMVATLHHLDVDRALHDVRDLLAPGGRFLVVGLAPPASVTDHLWDVASMVTNPVIGLAKHPRVSRTGPQPPAYPVQEPTMAYDDLRRLVTTVMPGARMRHRLGFRHTIAWTKPTSHPPRPQEPSVSLAEAASQVAPTGTLRVAINLGNPVLAQGTHDGPRGVTVAIAREVGRRLGVPVELVCFDAARESYAAVCEGRADLCFLANEPAREEGVVFTSPYVLIEGVYVTEADSPLETSDDVDRAGIRVGVREGSAYDLFLTRSLDHAEVVRAAEATDVFEEQGLDAAAGVRQPMEEYVAATGRRMLEPAFMEIQQSVGLPRGADPAAVAVVAAMVEELKASGFVHDELARSGVAATLAPPAP